MNLFERMQNPAAYVASTAGRTEALDSKTLVFKDGHFTATITSRELVFEGEARLRSYEVENLHNLQQRLHKEEGRHYRYSRHLQAIPCPNNVEVALLNEGTHTEEKLVFRLTQDADSSWRHDAYPLYTIHILDKKLEKVLPERSLFATTLKEELVLELKTYAWAVFENMVEDP